MKPTVQSFKGTLSCCLQKVENKCYPLSFPGNVGTTKLSWTEIFWRLQELGITQIKEIRPLKKLSPFCWLPEIFVQF